MNILLASHPDRRVLDKIRSEIAGLQAEIVAVADARLPFEEVRQSLRDQLEANWANKPAAYFHGYTYPGGDRRIPDAINFGFFVFLFGVDTLVDMIMRRLESAGGPFGLPAADRAAKLAGLKDKLEALECDEEREVLRLEAVGHTVLRRADARPDLVFDIWAEA